MSEDERLEQLNMEWQRQFEYVRQEQRLHFEKMHKTMHDVINVLCDAIKATVRDPDTVSKMGDLVQAGLTRLQEINRADDAEHDPSGRLN